MDTYLLHPLVVALVTVVAAAAIAIGFYYYASPYEKCMKRMNQNPMADHFCSQRTNW